MLVLQQLSETPSAPILECEILSVKTTEKKNLDVIIWEKINSESKKEKKNLNLQLKKEAGSEYWRAERVSPDYLIPLETGHPLDCPSNTEGSLPVEGSHSV